MSKTLQIADESLAQARQGHSVEVVSGSVSAQARVHSIITGKLTPDEGVQRLDDSSLLWPAGGMIRFVVMGQRPAWEL